jgi:ribosomal protein L11 methyltransferase
VSHFIQISFTDLQPEQRDILIAQLADAGYEGFEETENGLDAFINKKEFDKTLLEEISFKYQLPYKKKAIENVNWNQVWESNFQPVIIKDFVAVRADFHDPINEAEHEIIITPKMSFGTGHHATTYMMIEQMKAIDFRGKIVFDFGTGTGILAILAEKLGAGKILAIDNDDWSIENAVENSKTNHCRMVSVKKASSAPAEITFDIILANINKKTILENLTSLRNQLADSGILLISGMLEEDKEEILMAASGLKIRLEKELIRNNWICLRFHC